MVDLNPYACAASPQDMMASMLLSSDPSHSPPTPVSKHLYNAPTVETPGGPGYSANLRAEEGMLEYSPGADYPTDRCTMIILLLPSLFHTKQHLVRSAARAPTYHSVDEHHPPKELQTLG